jgi:hypothetical protein
LSSLERETLFQVIIDTFYKAQHLQNIGFLPRPGNFLGQKDVTFYPEDN